MRITLRPMLRQAAPALGLLLLASFTALPASAQYVPAYPPPAPSYSGMYPNGPSAYGQNQFWNNASYYVYQTNPNRYGSTYGDTDFGYATIPPATNPDSTANGSQDQNDSPMYVYNFTGGTGPVYDSPSDLYDLHCFPC